MTGRFRGKHLLRAPLRVMAAAGLVFALLASVSQVPVLGQQTGLVGDSTYVFAMDGMIIE